MLSGKTRNDITAFIAARKSLFTSLALFSGLINLLMLVPSVYMLQVYDRVLPSGNEMTLLMLTLIMAGLLALTGGLDYLRNMLVIRMSNQFDLALNSRVYDAAFQAKLHRTPGHLPLQAQTDLMILRRFITGNGIFAFLDLPWFPLYLLVIALFNPWLGLFACGGAVVLIVLALLNERLSGPPLTAANRSSAAAQGMQGSHFAHTEPAEAMGMQQYLRQRWLNRHCDSLKEQTQASDYSAKIMTTTKTVRLILQSLMLGLGGWLALDNTISPGMMIAGSILLGRALSPVEQVTGVWKSAKESRLAYQRLTALLAAHPQPSQKLALPVPQGASVGFSDAGRLSRQWYAAAAQSAFQPRAGRGTGNYRPVRCRKIGAGEAARRVMACNTGGSPAGRGRSLSAGQSGVRQIYRLSSPGNRAFSRHNRR